MRSASPVPKFALTLAACLATVLACRNPMAILNEEPLPEGMHRIVPPNRPAGDPDAGFQYLIYGDYIGSGIPQAVLGRFFENYRDTIFHREGPNSKMVYARNVFTMSNGVEVSSGNCFTCHAARLEGNMIAGLGNTEFDYTKNNGWQIWLLSANLRRKYGKKSPEYEAFAQTGRYYKALSPRIVTDLRGVNPAFRLEEACAARRQPGDLSYTADPVFEMSRLNIACDVPPLWNVRKKGAIYYNGMGRGDETKLLMQASVLGIGDSAEARRVQRRMNDVLAWICSLEAPRWTAPIDKDLAARGLTVFNATCSKCHGRYDSEAFYPNKIVPVSEVGTDSLYAWYFLRQSGLARWYNQSWYALSPPRSELRPSYGYIAPPLDGIWASAPYLHNGSVPTLADLLDSRRRPVQWKRNFENPAYDYTQVGWTYTRCGGKDAYDTRKPGYSNQGHTFGDKLSEEERKALLEYLKGL